MPKKKKKPANRPNLFDFLNQIYYKSRKYEYDRKVAPAYMLSMWLSHDERLIDIVNKINSLQFHLKDVIIYEYYMDKVPRGKRWIPWIKKTAKDKEQDKKVEALMVERCLSKRESTEAIKFMEEL